ncbi:hypothetical protein G6F24_018232 [Rhizopus arrhizus]|nr:hypothetical protein G6F24_018232 [Rhizopus arrhizus]
MGIAVGSHQRGQADVVATHFAHDVPKDGKAGDRLHGVGGVRRAENGRQAQSGNGQQGAAARRQNGTHSESPSEVRPGACGAAPAATRHAGRQRWKTGNRRRRPG